MKNIFRILMAVAVLFTASCAKEDISSTIASGEANVTFTVDLPELGTRAYGEGKKVDILHYNVYEYGTENRLAQLSGSKEAQAPGQALYTITIPMLKGMKYDIVFWAEKNGTGYYRLEDKVITVNYDGAIANDETRDAFFGSVTEFDPTNPGNKTSVELRRPFAQLNAITTDCQLIKKSGITEMCQSSLKVTSKLHNQFNIFSGVADGEVTNVEFAIADIPAETKTIDDTNTDMHLAMNYLLVNGEKELVDVEFSFVGKRGQTEFDFPVAQYSNIPVKRNYRTNIIGKLLTAATDFNVEIKADFGKSDQVVATDATAAQQALDNADKGTTIQLQPGVNYGTLLIRPVAGAANTITDCDYLVYRNEMLRKVEDLTIIGAPGAKVDGIKVVAGYVENSGSTGYVVDIKNLVIDGVEFSDNYVMSAKHSYSAPIFVDLSYINVDGLTVKNCKLVGDNDKMNFVYLYGSGNPSNSTFNTAAKNITISNNVVDGIARLCELRQAENVTITGNTIKNTYLHGMLLSVDKGAYSGNVTITNNTAENINDRFVRMAGAGDAVVVIKDNVIKLYKGADPDYIKVTDGTNVTIENNICSKDPIKNYDDFLNIISDDTWYDATKTELAIEDVADFAAFIETANSVDNFEGKTLKLTGDIDLYFKDITDLADGDPITFRPIGDTKYGAKNPFKGTFDGQGHTIKNLYQNGWDLNYHWDNYGSYGLFGKLEDATVKNVVIEGSESYIEGGDVSFIAGSATGNCVFENIEIKSGVIATYNNGNGGIIGWSGAGTYTFKNITIGEDVVLGGLWGSFDSSIGGIVGQAEPGATYNFENVTINCRIDAYNDCTASYDYYNYRMCGMIIGRCEETTTINGSNYPDLSKYNLSFNNVVVNYGDWMNYHY